MINEFDVVICRHIFMEANRLVYCTLLILVIVLMMNRYVWLLSLGIYFELCLRCLEELHQFPKNLKLVGFESNIYIMHSYALPCSITTHGEKRRPVDKLLQLTSSGLCLSKKKKKKNLFWI